MVVKLAGLWERGWITPIKEADLWAYPLRDFAVDGLCMSPISGIDSRHIKECASIEDAIADARQDELTVVFVDEGGSTPLQDFEHPDNVLYVLGRSGTSPKALYEEEEGDLTVHIETPEGKGLLWAHQAASIILYDRSTK